jgi:hypothetical protein
LIPKSSAIEYGLRRLLSMLEVSIRYASAGRMSMVTENLSGLGYIFFQLIARGSRVLYSMEKLGTNSVHWSRSSMA